MRRIPRRNAPRKGEKTKKRGATGGWSGSPREVAPQGTRTRSWGLDEVVAEVAGSEPTKARLVSCGTSPGCGRIQAAKVLGVSRRTATPWAYASRGAATRSRPCSPRRRTLLGIRDALSLPFALGTVEATASETRSEPRRTMMNDGNLFHGPGRSRGER